jgi:hypothetical protein
MALSEVPPRRWNRDGLGAYGETALCACNRQSLCEVSSTEEKGMTWVMERHKGVSHNRDWCMAISISKKRHCKVLAQEWGWYEDLLGTRFICCEA